MIKHTDQKTSKHKWIRRNKGSTKESENSEQNGNCKPLPFNTYFKDGFFKDIE